VDKLINYSIRNTIDNQYYQLDTHRYHHNNHFEHKLLLLAINSINKINSINNSMDNFTDKDNYYYNFDIKANNPFDMSPKQLEYINLFNYFKRSNLQLIILE